MKYFCIIAFLLITVYILTSPPIAYAAPIAASLEDSSVIGIGRQRMRGLFSATSGFPKKPKERKVVDGSTESTSVEKAGFVGDVNVDDNGEGLIYNADYHGVTTHPPSPKHPLP